MDIVFSNISKEYQVKKRQNNSFLNFFNRDYEIKSALKNVSFQIKKGEIIGYIGPNGAGKSTTIKIMTGILKPSSGECYVLGVNPMENRMQFVKRIGVVFGNRSNLMWDLPVIDTVYMMKKLYSIPEEVFLTNLAELTEMMDVEDLLQIPVRLLSLGQRMRCEIIVSLLHNPEILFLDEPTLGLDARSKIAVHQFIKKVNEKRNTTVILTTHDMNDIQALTSRVIIIGKGSKLFDGEFRAIKNKYKSTKKIRLEINQVDQINSVATQIKQQFRPNNMTVIANEIGVEISKEMGSLDDFIQFISKKKIIDNYQIRSLNIDEIIARYYSELDI
ncbi:ABC transporter ATP-binding protein [Companilactobacillus heilongjiangensis]|uniref:ABC transporter ATP-binding protein n=1 Tax=Companilactobacillus heilongjiangensis TaxID=1074467 RepID=UPI00069D73AB|nr:ATP-binding cassette domain-containing protein [Companilactobacillus heilongjiangensis]